MSCDCPTTEIQNIPGATGERGIGGSRGEKGAPGDLGPVGPQGNPGPAAQPGQDGSDGSSAFTLTTADFVQPAVGSDVTIDVVDSAWVAGDEPIWIATGGSYSVTGIPDFTHIVIRNLGYPGNAAVGATVGGGSKVTPSGVRGETGPEGPPNPGTGNVAGTNAFRADKGTFTQVQSGPVQVSFGTERFDSGDVYNIVSSTWTCPETGYYIFETQMAFQSGSGPYTLAFYKNGGFGVGTRIATAYFVELTLSIYLSSGVVYLTAGDTVVVVNYNAGSDTVIKGDIDTTWFSGFRVA